MLPLEEKYKHAEITKKIIGACLQVHTELNNGFAEVVYHRSLAYEFGLQEINFIAEYEMPIYYKHRKVGARRVDFFVDNIIPLEIKACTALDNTHLSQAINYLEAYNLEIGLLINFGSKSLEFRRLYNSKYKEVV